MLIIGFLALCQSFLAERATTSVAITIPSVVVIILLWFRPTDDHDSDCSEATPIKLPEWGILTIKPFFRTRFDFLSTSFDLCGKSIFQFKLLRVRPPSSPFRLSIFFLRLNVAVIEHCHRGFGGSWSERLLYFQRAGHQ